MTKKYNWHNLFIEIRIVYINSKNGNQKLMVISLMQFNLQLKHIINVVKNKKA